LDKFKIPECFWEKKYYLKKRIELPSLWNTRMQNVNKINDMAIPKEKAEHQLL